MFIMSGAEPLVEVCLENMKYYLFHVNKYCLLCYVLYIIQMIFGQVYKYMDGVQEVKIDFSFQLQTSQVFKKELPILVIQYITNLM